MLVSAQSAQTADINDGVLRDLVVYLIWTIEAEMAKNRVAELREQQYNLEMQELLFNHQQQREECEAAHIKQYQEFNQHWDHELQVAQNEDEQEILQTENAHTKQLEDNRQRLE